MSDEVIKAAADAMTPNEARETWNEMSRIMAKQAMQMIHNLIANSASYEIRKNSYDRACRTFIVAALGLSSEAEIPEGMTIEQAAQNLTPERYGAAIRRQAEEAVHDNPLQLMVIFAHVLELNDDLFLALESFAADKHRRRREADTANEIAKVLETLFPLHPTPQ
jgi:hypothetical protein